VVFCFDLKKVFCQGATTAPYNIKSPIGLMTVDQGVWLKLEVYMCFDLKKKVFFRGDAKAPPLLRLVFFFLLV
jgi:hypothetical protein